MYDQVLYLTENHSFYFSWGGLAHKAPPCIRLCIDLQFVSTTYSTTVFNICETHEIILFFNYYFYLGGSSKILNKFDPSRDSTPTGINIYLYIEIEIEVLSDPSLKSCICLIHKGTIKNMCLGKYSCH